jgi:DNA mismatch repair protein MutS
MALIAQYFEECDKYQNEYGENTIVLMQVGSFFEVYSMENEKKEIIKNKQIKHFADILDFAIVSKNAKLPNYNNCNIYMAGFKDVNIEKHVKTLQSHNYTIVVITQDENIKGTSRSIDSIYSPGTFFNSEQDITHITNNTICIWINYVKKNNYVKNNMIYIGVSNINIYTGETNTYEFNELYNDSPATYDKLEHFISIYNPSEAIIIGNISEKEIDNIINYSNLKCSMIHKISMINNNKHNETSFYSRAINCEKQKYQKEILNKFYTITDFQSFYQIFYENIFACQSFCFLLDFIYCHNPNLTKKIKEPIFYNHSDKLLLANHSLKQLNIINDGNHIGEYSSVLQFLNKCITPMGKRQFNYNLLNPINDPLILITEYNMIEHVLEKIDSFNFIKIQLYNIKDLSKLNRQIIHNKIFPKNIINLYHNLKVCKSLFDSINRDKYFTNYLKNKINNFKNIGEKISTIINFIETTLNIELSENINNMKSNDVNFINKGVSKLLDNKTELLLNSMDKLEAIKNKFNEFFEINGCKGKKINSKNRIDDKVSLYEPVDYVKIHETEKNNFMLCATKARCKILLEYLPKKENKICLNYFSTYNNSESLFDFNCDKNCITHSNQTATNDNISSVQIKTICKHISNIKLELKEIINSVYNEFIKKLEYYQNDIEDVIQFIIFLDLIYCKSYVAKKYNYCKPTIDVTSENSFFEATGLRHCLVEQILEDELYVSNNISLGKDTIGMMLYGVNSNGKSCFGKSIGIATIMAQSGMYVPCNTFNYFPYNYIFTRILNTDDYSKGMSTFITEITELNTIFRFCDNHSLIIMDEVASGTESISAKSIVVASILYIYNRGGSFITATHLHEIASYKELNCLDKLDIKHMSVTYDKKSDQLIYNRTLQDGPGDSIYGLEVCKSLHLPNEFIETAYDIRLKYNPETINCLDTKSSHFNNKQLMGICEKCKINLVTEVHHLQHQKNANIDGIIKNGNNIFHKNNKANLISVCDKCHDEFHKTNRQHKKVKTTKGIEIVDEY